MHAEAAFDKNIGVQRSFLYFLSYSQFLDVFPLDPACRFASNYVFHTYTTYPKGGPGQGGNKVSQAKMC